MSERETEIETEMEKEIERDRERETSTQHESLKMFLNFGAPLAKSLLELS